MTITIHIEELAFDAMPASARSLILAAKEATANSYAPYSNFNVGAALYLEDGTIIKGANQENAAFSVTMCAERAAIFNAQSNYPDKAITHIAIAARNANGFMKSPIPPCGSCRQAILEMETRYKRDIVLYLYGTEKVYVVKSVKDLLPLTFVESSMK